jgi:hypothetical protein
MIWDKSASLVAYQRNPASLNLIVRRRIERSGCYSPSIERLVSTYRHCYSLCISAGGLLRKWCPVAVDRSRLTIGWSARV